MHALRSVADGMAGRRRFVDRVAASENAWALRDESGLAACKSIVNPRQDVLLFWSDRAYAARAAKTSFPQHEVVKVPLFELLFRFLPGMSDDGVLAGPNWSGDLVGLEVDPMELAEEITQTISPKRLAEYAERLRRSIEDQKGRG